MTSSFALRTGLAILLPVFLLFGHKYVLENAGRRALTRMAEIFETQSKGRYKLHVGKINRSGVLDIEIAGIRVYSNDSLKDIVSFQVVKISFFRALPWSKEPLVSFVATGLSGELRAQVKIDKSAFQKGFVHQVDSQYEFVNFDVGPVFDDLLKYYFSKGSLLRSPDHPDFRRNNRMPINLLRIQELRLRGKLTYVSGSLPEADFGHVVLNTEITKSRLHMGRGDEGINLDFEKSSWKMSESKRTISPVKPVEMNSPALRLVVQPKVEVSRGVPHKWSTFLTLDLEPRTRVGAEFAHLLTMDWRCGIPSSHKGKIRILAFFQEGRLGCMERPD